MQDNKFVSKQSERFIVLELEQVTKIEYAHVGIRVYCNHLDEQEWEYPYIFLEDEAAAEFLKDYADWFKRTCND